MINRFLEWLFRPLTNYLEGIFARAIERAFDWFFHNFIGLKRKNTEEKIMKTATEKKFDDIIENFVKKSKERDGYEVFTIPEPLKISILGHSGSGKTTLIETMVKYLSTEFYANEILSINIPYASQQKYKRIHEIVDTLCKTDLGFVTNLNLGRGTSSVQTFDFDIEFKLFDNVKLALPVMIQDTPGGFHHFVNLDSEKYDDCSPEYKQFVNHLKESQIVIIPIDTIKLMSVSDDSELCGAYSDTIQLESIKSNLQQYFAKNPDRRYSLHFVLTKCETYFSQDKSGCEAEKCFEKFSYWYSDVSNLFYKEKNVDIHYTPVETFGSFKLKNTKCEVIEDQYGKYLRNDSLFESSGQKERIINGVNDLTDDMFYMIEDMIRNGYIYEIRLINANFINNDKGVMNYFTGRNADSDKVKALLGLIDMNRPILDKTLKDMVSKNRTDGFEYQKIIREKL